MLVHQKVPERTEVLTEENQHLFTSETLAKINSQAAGKSDQGTTEASSSRHDAALAKQTCEEDILLRPLHESYPPPPPVRPVEGVRGRRSQRETILRRGGKVDRSPPPSSEHASGEQVRGQAPNDGHDLHSAAGVQNGWVLTGELLYILRPLAYLVAMYVWGVRSWRAWGCSLAVDVGAWACSSSGSQSASPELSRRTTQWAYYLVRSPFYEAMLASCVLRRLVDLLKRLPFVTAALGMAQSYVEAYRERYFYISGSSV
jgi:hypothetical protein